MPGRASIPGRWAGCRADDPVPDSSISAQDLGNWRRVIADERRCPMRAIPPRFPRSNPDKLSSSPEPLATAIRTVPSTTPEGSQRGSAALATAPFLAAVAGKSLVNGHRVRLSVGLRRRRSRGLHCASCRPAGEAACRVLPLLRQNLWPATCLRALNRMSLLHCLADQIQDSRIQTSCCGQELLLILVVTTGNARYVE
jgi:hypothetical protein